MLYSRKFSSLREDKKKDFNAVPNDGKLDEVLSLSRTIYRKIPSFRRIIDVIMPEVITNTDSGTST